MKSGFVQIFISTVHFTDHSKVHIYKSKVRKKIMDTVRGCNKALFIFDEIDKMPEGVMDAVKPFIDYREEVDVLDFRQTIFIFLSNTLVERKSTKLPIILGKLGGIGKILLTRI